MVKIGVDIFGGDYAPEAALEGAMMAVRELPEDGKVVCIGDRHIIERYAQEKGFDNSLWEIVHTDEYIDMGENPSKSYQQKPNASIPLGFKLLKSGQIQGFASAGNTGAMMVGAMMVIKAIPGIIRPAIATFVPIVGETPILLLDVGLNPDAKPEVLVQYGIMGSLYMEHVFNIKQPRVALLNIGSEEEKGNLLTKATYPLMRECKNINFVGNVEGHDFFSNEKADVMVCDGFVGNIILKSSEAIYDMVKSRDIHDAFFEKFNYENFGGTPILGINGVAVIGHGISSGKAIKNMILQTYHVVHANLIEKLTEAFKEYTIA
ncbi:MAG TPA: phosphate acyltransferase PlsX [Bacteroidales bacterium]|nr:phosphate acyltransferase PlsX [Bacteroidales bacterium]HOK98323.1 phosphate acyltransferase PlsX [Bacteroidales bacterium]HPO65190.1 phosphate acyltransferase PlsX [Bacteroidales bacterium]